ncbi:MAG TPA: DUF1631 family protein, partial [Xanthomonadaceae bacterium]|nr:DUF1631 family protein [Xanthomonadaceae bacterium]
MRTLLEGIFEIVTGEVDRGLIATLDGLEQQLFKLAEQARNNELQMRCLEALGNVKRGRYDLMPRYIASLESSVAGLRDVANPNARPTDEVTFNDLSLVAEADMDERTLLHEISSRAEMHASLPLFLLGQRFGVLAGKPALDTASLPIGPETLCRHLRSASLCIEFSSEHRQLLFRQFERHLLSDYARLVDVVNAYLVNQGVLPTLSYIPTRFKSAPRGEDAAAATAPNAKSTSPAHSAQLTSHGQPIRLAPTAGGKVLVAPSSAFTGWPGESIGAVAPPIVIDEDVYTNLRELLRSSRPAQAAGASAHGHAHG